MIQDRCEASLLLCPPCSALRPALRCPALAQVWGLLSPIVGVSKGATLICCAAQVGQILFHGRISQHNSMLPFVTQIIEVMAALYPPNLPTPGEAMTAVAQEAAQPTASVPVRDPETGQAQTSADSGTQLAQQTAFPGLQV